MKKDAWSLLPTTTKTPPGISAESELLRMTVRQTDGGGAGEAS
jgi:hypothetical protein